MYDKFTTLGQLFFRINIIYIYFRNSIVSISGLVVHTKKTPFHKDVFSN